MYKEGRMRRTAVGLAAVLTLVLALVPEAAGQTASDDYNAWLTHMFAKYPLFTQILMQHRKPLPAIPCPLLGPSHRHSLSLFPLAFRSIPLFPPTSLPASFSTPSLPLFYPSLPLFPPSLPFPPVFPAPYFPSLCAPVTMGIARVGALYPTS